MVGLETAATLLHAGCRVTIVEAAPRIMARFFPAELSQLLTDVHTGRGVHVRVCVVIERLEPMASGWVIHLRGGAAMAADFLVIGIGVVPNSEIAALAGLPTRLEGVEVDARARTAAAARSMLGIAAPEYAETPWIWSDQREFNMQVIGSPAADRVVMRGTREAGRLTAFHLRFGKIAGATTINDSRNKSAIRKLIEHSAELSPEQLADSPVDLKKLSATVSGGVVATESVPS